MKRFGSAQQKSQMGYPVVNVAEKDGGIHIRQDRFLETGPAPPEHNETIWLVSSHHPVICSAHVTRFQDDTRQHSHGG